MKSDYKAGQRLRERAARKARAGSLVASSKNISAAEKMAKEGDQEAAEALALLRGWLPPEAA